MNPEINEFKHYKVSEIWKLISDVYCSSDTMSEVLTEKFRDFQAFEKYFQETISLNNCINLITETDGIPEGYLTITPKKQSRLRHTAELNMGVHHNARGKGLGKYLLDEAISRTRDSGCIEIIYLHVRVDNIPAVRLYKQCGFEILTLLERDTRINNRYFDGLLMRRFV